MATSAKRKVTTDIDEIISGSKAKAKTRTSVAASDPKFAAIESNPFYSVLFDEKLSPKKKSEAFAKLRTFPGTKEQSRQLQQEEELFKEYLQNVRKEMAKEMIALTNTEAFSELKDTYQQFNQGLIDFENQIGPLTDIIDAVYKLRKAGMTLDAFKAIQKDKEDEEDRRRELLNLTDTANATKAMAEKVQHEIAALKTKKSFFGFGGLPQDVKESIAMKEVDLKAADDRLLELSGKITMLENAAPPPSENPEFDADKEKLRELLDISSEEHKDRQVALVEAALKFVEVSEERIGSIRNHLGQMNGQIEGLGDANDSMSAVYSIMEDGYGIAKKSNAELRAELDKAPEGEDAVSKMEREARRLALDQHIKAVEDGETDTVTTTADLASQAFRIKGMRDNNTDNMNTARTLHSQGVAGVADRLSTVLQAVSMAALGESSSMAGDTLQKMRASTNAVTQKEAIRRAMGVNDQADALDKVIDDLAGYGKVAGAAIEITREGISSIREKLANIAELSKGTREAVNDAYAVNAELDEPVSLDKSPPPAIKRPFGNLGKGA